MATLTPPGRPNHLTWSGLDHGPLCLLSKIKMAYNPLGSIPEGQKDFCLSLLMDCCNLPVFLIRVLAMAQIPSLTGQLEAKD